jgi:hypothetical protein
LRLALLLGITLAACSTKPEPSAFQPSKGLAAAATCAKCSFAGNEGMCVGRDIDIAQDALNDPQLGPLLETEVTGCDPSEVCLVCNDPTNNGDNTGACDVGPLLCPGQFPERSCQNPAAFTSVDNLESCGDNSYCLSYQAIDDPELVTLAAQCEDPRKACVPAAVINSGGFPILQSCTGVGGLEGRCLPLSIPAVGNNANFHVQGECGASERCLPCFDAVNGTDTGACRIGCDPGPRQPARSLPNCGDNGRCVPTQSIDANIRGYMTAQNCGAGNLCVPENVLNKRHAPCRGQRNGQQIVGTCASTQIMQVPGEDYSDVNYCGNLFGEGFGCVPCSANMPGCTTTP